MAPPWRQPHVLYQGFSFHTADARTQEAAWAITQENIGKKRKTGNDWAGLRELPDGFYLPRKTPANYENGYSWFSRVLGHLVWEPGQTSNWHVVAHPRGYDEANLRNAALSSDASRKTAQASAAPEASAASTAPASPAHSAAVSASAVSASAAPEASAAPAAPSASASGAASAAVPCRPQRRFKTKGSAAPPPLCSCPVLLLRERRQVLEQRRLGYRLGELLGEGQFAHCYLARRVADDREVAVKTLRAMPNQDRYAWAEAYVLDRCRGHPGFPQFLDVFAGPVIGQLSFVLEHAGQDLSKILANTYVLERAAIRQILASVASALQFLHGLGLLHADVKPHNILAKKSDTEEWTAKLGDLGSVIEAPSLRHQLFPEFCSGFNFSTCNFHT